MPRLDRRTFVAAMTAPALPLRGAAPEFRSQWPSGVTRPWAGPEYWANPLQDWQIRDGRLECIVSGGDRNVFLLTREVAPGPGDLRMEVTLGRLEENRGPLSTGFVGFRVGIRGSFGDYRDSAVRGEGLNAGIATDGRLFIGKLEENAPRLAGPLQNIALRLTARPDGGRYTLTLEAGDLKVERAAVPAEWIEGGLALVSSAGVVAETPAGQVPLHPSGTNKRNTARTGNVRFWFRDWKLSGSKVVAHEQRAWGPLLFAMHTVHRGVMKLTVQLAPADAPRATAKLEFQRGKKWIDGGFSGIDSLARTATFRVARWDDTRDTPYRVLYTLDGREHRLEGTVRANPRRRDKLIVGALTCNNDFGFPHQDVVDALAHFKPDVLLFTGDQIYERVAEYGIQMEPLLPASLDYLRKWYLFGWSYGPLLRDIPTVCLPDDHDVYHGNVWGVAGKKADKPGAMETVAEHTKAWQDSGGYKMAAEWVNAVQRTQTSHLPDPPDPAPVEQNIGVYFTAMDYGGVSFALLEDRKWKSAPGRAVPWAKIVNGWAQNPNYNAAEHGDVEGAELLGARQLKFLDSWAADWSAETYLKIAVSQTILANVATLPPPANTDAVTGSLPVQPLGAYPEGEMATADHDSNGWPQTPRKKALLAMRRCLAFHIGGDQHLGSTIQYGIDDHNDGPWALCTPAISNLFPRRWYPPQPGRNRKEGSPRYCGEFRDGFGNLITVHAISNPSKFGKNPPELHDRAPGYGIVEIDKKRRTLTFANWPRHTAPAAPGAKPYDGWPITIHQYDNGLNGAKFALDPIETAGVADALVQVTEETTGEIVYTVRAQGTRFAPKVFLAGRYTVKALHPATKKVVLSRTMTARLTSAG